MSLMPTERQKRIESTMQTVPNGTGAGSRGREDISYPGLIHTAYASIGSAHAQSTSPEPRLPAQKPTSQMSKLRFFPTFNTFCVRSPKKKKRKKAYWVWRLCWKPWIKALTRPYGNAKTLRYYILQWKHAFRHFWHDNPIKPSSSNFYGNRYFAFLNTYRSSIPNTCQLTFRSKPKVPEMQHASEVLETIGCWNPLLTTRHAVLAFVTRVNCFCIKPRCLEHRNLNFSIWHILEASRHKLTVCFYGKLSHCSCNKQYYLFPLGRMISGGH